MAEWLVTTGDLFLLTVEYVHPYAGRRLVHGCASVDSGVRLDGLLDEEAARRHETLLRQQTDATPRRIEVDVLRIVRPNYRLRRFRSVLEQARQVYRRSHVYEQVGATDYLRDGLYKNLKKI